MTGEVESITGIVAYKGSCLEGVEGSRESAGPTGFWLGQGQAGTHAVAQQGVTSQQGVTGIQGLTSPQGVEGVLAT